MINTRNKNVPLYRAELTEEILFQVEKPKTETEIRCVEKFVKGKTNIDFKMSYSKMCVTTTLNYKIVQTIDLISVYKLKCIIKVVE